MLDTEELQLLGTECDYCNDDDRVLYVWHGDIWCARCMLENVSAQLPLIVTPIRPTGDPDIDDYASLRSDAVPRLWQTPDGKFRCGRKFYGVYPKSLLDEDADTSYFTEQGDLTYVCQGMSV